MDIYSQIAKMVERMLDGVHVTVYEAVRNNDTVKHGIVVRPEDSSIAPIIYVDQLVEEGDSLEEIVRYVVKTYHRNAKPADDLMKQISNVEDYSSVRDSFRPRLISKKLNLKLLEDVPHKDFLDMAVIVAMKLSEDESATAKVTYDLLKYWNKSFDDIYLQAIFNQTKEKAVIKGLAEILSEYGPLPPQMRFSDCDMYVLTNERCLHGAVHILNENVMYSFAQQMDSDILVIPSSVHEVLLCPMRDRFRDMDYPFSEIIKSVNEDEVSPEDVLSDHPYIYRKDTGWDKYD